MIATTVLLLAAIEIRITDYLWKSPARLHGVLGKVKSRNSECADATGRQINYERGYVCYRDNKIVVMEYELKNRVKSPAEAIGAVGLKMTAEPRQFVPNGGYMWSVFHGNALRAGYVPATRVIATVGNTSSVTVDVSGE